MKQTKITFLADCMFIEEKVNIHIIKYRDLVGIFCEHPYCIMITADNNKKLVYYSLENISRKLPSFFALCSQSALVNLNYADSLKAEKLKCYLHLSTGITVLASRRRKREIIEKVKIKLGVIRPNCSQNDTV